MRDLLEKADQMGNAVRNAAAAPANLFQQFIASLAIHLTPENMGFVLRTLAARDKAATEAAMAAASKAVADDLTAKAKALFAGAGGAAAGGAAAEQQPGAPSSPVHQESPPSGVQGREEEMAPAMADDEADHGAHAGDTSGLAANGGGAPSPALALDAAAAAIAAADGAVDAAVVDADPAAATPTGAAAATVAPLAMAHALADAQAAAAAAAVPGAVAPAPPVQAPASGGAAAAAAAPPPIAQAPGGDAAVPAIGGQQPTPLNVQQLASLYAMSSAELHAAIGRRNFPHGIYRDTQRLDPPGRYRVDLKVTINGNIYHCQRRDASHITLRLAMQWRNDALAAKDAHGALANFAMYWTRTPNAAANETNFLNAANHYIGGGLAVPALWPAAVHAQGQPGAPAPSAQHGEAAPCPKRRRGGDGMAGRRRAKKARHSDDDDPDDSDYDPQPRAPQGRRLPPQGDDGAAAQDRGHASRRRRAKPRKGADDPEDDDSDVVIVDGRE